jgi:hypothetical protein
MVVTLPRDEQKHSKLLRRPSEHGMTFEDGIPVLTGELSMVLCPLYLRKVGEVTFLDKLEEGNIDKRDVDYAAAFLERHNVQPTRRNCFKLMLGARLHLLFADQYEGEARYDG